MKLCVFAGTFNPIHNAHLKMAQYVLDNFKFDKILFIPAHIPPHKCLKEDLSQHRFKMVQLAINDNSKFEISDIEYKRNGKSYTYETIVELYKQYKLDGKINFIIGTDAFKQIESWYKSEKLKNLIDFIVFVRENEIVDLSDLRNKGYNFKFADMNFIDISSTDLRKRIKSNENIKEFVPKIVEEYINEYGLYKN